MRAEGPKERPTTHSSSSTTCSDAKSAKAAPNMAQVEEVYITPTLWSVVMGLLCVLDVGVYYTLVAVLATM